MTTNNETTRDAGNGQYAHSTMDVLCTCGHTLGTHTAAVVDGRRDCLHDDGCDCTWFRKVRAKKAGT